MAQELSSERVRLFRMPKLGRGHDEEAAVRLDQLAEWIDLIAFVRSDLTPSYGSKRMRELYRGALDCAQRLRGAGMHVLAGVWDDPKPAIPEYAYAVLAILPRALDPGALKRTHILLDRREVARMPIDWGLGLAPHVGSRSAALIQN